MTACCACINPSCCRCARALRCALLEPMPQPCTDSAIKDNLLFSGLPPAGLAAVIDSMQPQVVAAGKDIIKQVTEAGGTCKRCCWC